MSIRSVLTLCVLVLTRAFTPNLRRCERLPKQIGSKTHRHSKLLSREVIMKPFIIHGSMSTVALVMKQNEEHEVTDEPDQQQIDLRPQVTKLVSFFDAILDL
eukprot:CCRYP_001307-RA/>CCRYP_001307-RA protein AED:0.38 eAED:0.39 QI:270/0/0.5/1/0/0/2/0/101